MLIEPVEINILFNEKNRWLNISQRLISNSIWFIYSTL